MYGTPLTVNYSATLVQDKQVKMVASSIKATVSEVYGLDGVTIDSSLKMGDPLPSTDLAVIQKTVDSALTGEKGAVISSQSFKDLAKALPGSTGALSGSKVYTMKDGNQYYYEYWLKTDDLQGANKDAKYGDPIIVTYSASLKWIDPKTK